MDILEFLHWIISPIIMNYSGLLSPNILLPYVFLFNILILASYVVFRRCLFWDIQRKTNIHFLVDKESGCYPSDKECMRKRSTYFYLNVLLLGVRLGLLPQTLLGFGMYFLLLGQYHTPVGDDIYKYRY